MSDSAPLQALRKKAFGHESIDRVRIATKGQLEPASGFRALNEARSIAEGLFRFRTERAA